MGSGLIKSDSISALSFILESNWVWHTFVSQPLFKKMIKGHGIDIEEISSIQKVYEKNARFAQKILTAAEFDRFEKLTGKRKMEYLAGRWSAKEAFSKAWGTGIGCVTFQDLEILNDDKGAPVFTKSPFSGKVWVSLSHAGNIVTASVILEEHHENE